MRRRSSSSQITEDRRGHSTEEGGAQSGHTRSDKVRVQRRRSSSSRITADRRGHSTEEGSVQSGHRGQTRSECRVSGGPAPVGSQRTDEVTVQKREVSSQVRQRSDEVRVQSKWRSSSSWISTEDRRGHSTEEGGVQPGQTRSDKVRVTE